MSAVFTLHKCIFGIGQDKTRHRKQVKFTSLLINVFIYAVYNERVGVFSLTLLSNVLREEHNHNFCLICMKSLDLAAGMCII